MSSGVRVKGLALWVYCPGALRIPEGPYTLPMELGPKKNHPYFGFGECMWDPLGILASDSTESFLCKEAARRLRQPKHIPYSRPYIAISAMLVRSRCRDDLNPNPYPQAPK